MNTQPEHTTDCNCFTGPYHYFPLTEMDKWCGQLPRCAHCGAQSARNAIADETTMEWLCDRCLKATERIHAETHASSKGCVVLLERTPECLARDTPTLALPTPAVVTNSLGPCPDCSSFVGPTHVWPVAQKAGWCGHFPPCGHCQEELAFASWTNATSVEFIGPACFTAVVLNTRPPYLRSAEDIAWLRGFPELARCGPPPAKPARKSRSSTRRKKTK